MKWVGIYLLPQKADYLLLVLQNLCYHNHLKADKDQKVS